MNLMDLISDIPVVLMDLPTTVRGFVCLGEDYEPCIIINARLTIEEQRKAFWHEYFHVRNGDMDNQNFHEYGGASYEQ